MIGKKERILFSSEDVEKMTKEVGKERMEDFSKKGSVLVDRLRARTPFSGGPVRVSKVALPLPAVHDHDKKSKGEGRIPKDLRVKPSRRICIIDSNSKSRCTLNPEGACIPLNKPYRRQGPATFQYKGFVIPNVFVVRCGWNDTNPKGKMPYVSIYDKK